MTYLSCDSDVDLNSAEIIFLHVHKYKCLQNCNFNLNSKYITSYEDGILSVVNNDSFVDLHNGLNIKIICGVNGSGKTTIMEAIHIINSLPESFLVLKDKNDNFWSNRQLTIEYNGKLVELSFLTHLNISSRTSLRYETSDADITNIHVGLLSSYLKNPSIYDDIVGRTLFTHFTVKHWDFDFLASTILDWLHGDFSLPPQDKFRIETAIRQRPVRALFYLQLVGESIGLVTSPVDPEDAWETIFDAVDRTFFNQQELDRITALEATILAMMGEEYSTSDFDRIELERLEITRELEKIFSTAASRHFKRQERMSPPIWWRLEPHLKNPEAAAPPPEKDRAPGSLLAELGQKDSNLYLRDLSSGELQRVYLTYATQPTMAHGHHIVHVLDEPDKSMHPEWARQFLLNYIGLMTSINAQIDEYNQRSDGHTVNRTNNLIIATHSPLLLSDVTSDHVIFLKKKDGLTEVVPNVKSTFAGNIGEMLSENYFMDFTIGELAKKKLEGVINFLDTRDSSEFPGKTEEEILTLCERIIGNIGDDILRKLMADKFERARQ